MQMICLHSKREEIQMLADLTQPFAMSHHGGVTDRFFREGRAGQVHDFVKAVHDHGLLAGVSSHNPDCIKRMANEGWEVDFFMTCFHFLTRPVAATEQGRQSAVGVRRPERRTHVLSRRSIGHVRSHSAGEAALPGIQNPGGGPSLRQPGDRPCGF